MINTTVLLLGVGILSVSIIAMLIQWKSHTQVDSTTDLLKEAIMANIDTVDEIKKSDQRLEQMMEIVQRNTEAMTAVKMAVEQNSNSLQRLSMESNSQSEAIMRILAMMDSDD